MPKAFSDTEKEYIRTRLIEQGERLFTVYGLKKTTVDEIAAAAGVSKGAFYLFYPSKEDLFMDVVELAEQRSRIEILAAIEEPGPTPRARFAAVLRKAFSILANMPILKLVARGDFDLIARRMAAGRMDDHMASDMAFMEELVTRCLAAGIPLRVGAGQISLLLYPLALAHLHGGELDAAMVAQAIDLLLDLAAAYCVGEVEVGRE